MLQRKNRLLQAALAGFGACCIAVGCDDSATSAATGPATTAAGKIISLSPAATDLLLAMGVGDRLVGVSTYDNDPRLAGVPRVGDYENVDWERIASIAPTRMVVQMAPERVPAGLRDRAAKLGIALHVSHIDRLEDVLREIKELGPFIERAEDATSLREKIETQLENISERVKSRPRVRTLIVTSGDGDGVAARETYLDELLTIAGGENVVTAKGYVQLDREAMLKLAPDAIIHLAPSPTAAERASMMRTWKAFDGLQAIKNGRLLMIEEPWALLPASHVGDLAERMADFLHGPPATQPAND